MSLNDEEEPREGDEPHHNRRQQYRESLRDSVRVLEQSAFTIHQDHTRSIGGRLGGHFDSVRGVHLLEQESPPAVVGEETPLVIKASRPAHASPPLRTWIVLALTCAGAYAFYNIFIKKGSYSINPILGGVTLQFVAALLGSTLLGTMVLFGDDATDKIHYDRNGLLWSVCAGLAVGTAEMLSFCVSGMGVAASQFIPVIIGGSVMFGAVLGLLLLGEKMMFHGWSGVMLLVTGIALVATDPGEKVEEGGGGNDSSSPPLAIWIGPALICATAYAFYNIFIKKGSASINPILGGVILQFVAALFGCLLLGTVVTLTTMELQYDLTGIMWACCAGVAVGTAELLSFCVSGMGVQASQSIPIIIGGSVMFGAVLGLLMLGETLMLQGWSGVLLLMTGIALVATDPGEKVAGH